MQNSFLLFVTVFCFLGMNSSAQEVLKHSYSLTPGMKSPSASISDVSWVQGHWIGEAFGGIIEEIWSPPLAGSMMCVFKLAVDNKVQLYEIITISEIDNSLLLKLKHFNANLTGWEEKDQTIDFPLVKIENEAIHFDGFSFVKISENEMNIFVMIEQQDGSEQEVKFYYKRYKKSN